jgi:hypothetical protein
VVPVIGWSALILGSILITSKMLSTDTVIAETTTVQLPVQAPVLDRIADCIPNAQKTGLSF